MATVPPPLDSSTERQILDSFGKQGLMRHLGAVISGIRQGKVSIRLPYAAAVTQQHGYFHAGATSAIADSAGGYAGLSVFPSGSSVLTVEFKINLLAPAQYGHLEAEGKVVRSGRTLTVCKLEVFHVTDDSNVLMAVGQQTLIRLP